jgi:hypothetical protein
MIVKSIEKNKAIALRKQGLAYSEILKQVPVAKSTLSLWLREVGLSRPQKQALTAKRIAAQARGAQRKREIRLERTLKIKQKAQQAVTKLIKDPQWLVGTLLYWAEGTKQKKWMPSQGIAFTNMDVNMLLMFRKWAIRYLQTEKLVYELYIHEKADIPKAQRYWEKIFHLKKNDLKIYIKKHNPKTVRHNTGIAYYGVMRIWIPKSTDLNRQIEGWIEGVVEYCK